MVSAVHRRAVGIFWVSTVFRVFMFFLCVRPPLYVFLVIFFSSLLWKKRQNTLPFPLLQHKDSLQDCCAMWPQWPFLTRHAVEKLLASKFSLSSTSALFVLLPLGSFQHVHVITELEAPIHVLVHFSVVQCSHSQREHHHICTSGV